MPLLNTGVSAGVPVANQATGVSLSAVNDYAYILISNAAPTPGPDSQGVLTCAGPFTGNPQIALEKVISPADFNAGNWTALQGAVPRTTGVILSGNTFTLIQGTSIDFTLPSVQGFYAVRVRLNTLPTGNSVLVTGSTFAVLNAVSNPSEIALLQQLNLNMLAVALALSDMNGTNYLEAVGGSF